eukprot:TRINITY_DN24455_c0_g1_i1.p1 TRINITY_DN24455_c0_g1~~TRINITY_DN24455_c0_g1_i1.p1  ORF type:complete len:569 (+),score=139.35 TRINITY_DN24455_c0_g1_i1:42-1748(+)
MKYVPGGIYTALLDGDEEVVAWCLDAEIEKTVSCESVDDAMHQFLNSTMVKAVARGKGGKDAVIRAKDLLVVAYEDAQHQEAQRQQITEQERLIAWRKDGKAALERVNTLIKELVALSREEATEEAPLATSPDIDPTPDPEVLEEDPLQDDFSLNPLSWAAKDFKKVYSAARRGVKKGIRRGAKIAGLASKDDQTAKVGPKVAVKSVPAKAAPVKAAPVKTAPATKAVPAGKAAPTPKLAPGKPAKGVAPEAKLGKVKASTHTTKGKPTLASSTVRDAVASAGMSAGVLGGAISLRKEIEDREKCMIEEGIEGKGVGEMVLPAIQDAAVAAGTASGTAWAVAQAAEHPICQQASTFVGPAVTGLFAMAGVGSAFHTWSAGRCTERDLKKVIAKISISTGTSLGCLAAASVSVPCAAALAMGSAALDLSGTTDTIVSQIFGKDRRGVRVELIKCYAMVLNISPTASDEQARERFKELSSIISHHGTVEDKAALDEACLRFLMLREEARGNGPKAEFKEHDGTPEPSPLPVADTSYTFSWVAWGSWSSTRPTCSQHIGVDFTGGGGAAYT